MQARDVSRRVERLLIVRPREGADCDAAREELEGLPGVLSICLDRVIRGFNVVFDPIAISDDELAAALGHHGYEVIGWQEARIMHANQQRMWLLEQIRTLALRPDLELADRGTYAEGVTKGAVDAYARTARAFGLVTDAEIRELIPARSLEGPARD